MTANPSPALNNLFMLDDITLKSSGDNQVIMSNHRTKSVIEISSTMSNLASYCTSFRTLQDHHQYISERFNLPDDIKGELTNTLEGLLNFGMLVSAYQLKERTFISHQSISSNQHTEQWVLGIHSCDRATMLERLLQSCIAHINETTPKPTFVFIDDSRDQEEEKKNYKVLSHFCQETKLTLHYWNRSQRSEYAEKLSASLPEIAPSINWLLNPSAHNSTENSTGLAKNFIQLFAINKKLIMVDDDCLIAPKETLQGKPGISLKPCETQFSLFSSEKEMEVGIHDSPINPFQSHLEQLNTPLHEIFEADQLSNTETWKELPRSEALLLSRGQTIGLTVNSIVGAQNTRHTDLFFTRAQHEPQLFEAFLNKHSNKNPIKQLSWFGPINSTTNKYIPFTCTTISGLGATELPALTLPIGRGQDSFLGNMYAFLYPQTRSLFFNWALPHDPIPARTWNPNETPTTQAYRAIYALRRLLTESAPLCNQTSPVARMAFFSNTLNNWVVNSNGALKKQLSQAITERLSGDLYAWSEIKKKTETHPIYNSYVDKLINKLKIELMETTRNIDPIEAELLALSKPLISALKDWPKIIDHIKQHNFS